MRSTCGRAACNEGSDAARTFIPWPSRALRCACRSTQVLTWLLLPFFQYYSEAGDFTVKGRCEARWRTGRCAALHAVAARPFGSGGGGGLGVPRVMAREK